MWHLAAASVGCTYFEKWVVDLIVWRHQVGGFNRNMMICKNCEQSFEGSYCHHCGQKASVGRINRAYLFQEVLGGIFQVNKGFFYTVWVLFVEPGRHIHNFLDGKRRNYFKPIPYLLTLSTLYFLMVLFTNQNTWLDDLISGFTSGASGNDVTIITHPVVVWFSKNYAYTTLLLLPVFSFASYRLFSKFGKNYLEHVILNAYVTGQQAIIYAFFTIFMLFLESPILESLPYFAALAYTFWVFWQFFSPGNWAMNILRTFLTYVLYMVLSLVLVFLLFALLGVE